MDPTLRAVLAVCMRWIHVTSVVTLIGGFIYARWVLAPALAALAGSDGNQIGRRAAANFRPLIYTVITTALISGLYNYLTKASYPPTYHMWMGIKLLIVIHIFVSAIPYALLERDEAWRKRKEISIAISGLIVFAISAYLRYISLQAVR